MIPFYRIKHYYPAIWGNFYGVGYLIQKDRIEYEEVKNLPAKQHRLLQE